MIVPIKERGVIYQGSGLKPKPFCMKSMVFGDKFFFLKLPLLPTNTVMCRPLSRLTRGYTGFHARLGGGYLKGSRNLVSSGS